MDAATKQIIGQVSGVLIQGLFSYLAQAGLNPDEIDAVFAREREEFKRKNPNTLPPPSA